MGSKVKISSLGLEWLAGDWLLFALCHQGQANLREASLDLLGGGWGEGVGLPVLSRLWCWGLPVPVAFVVLFCLSFLHCLVIQGRHQFDLGGKVHLGSARGALAMATSEMNEERDLEQMIPMRKVRGSILHNVSMLVRETLKVDQCILCNSCWLCRGCETTRLLPYGWHKDYSVARTQLCTSVLSRISGLCNDCIRTVTDIRIVQHAGLTADGLLGVRLIIYIGMLVNVDKLYMIPNVLTSALDSYIEGSLDPSRWLYDPRYAPAPDGCPT